MGIHRHDELEGAGIEQNARRPDMPTIWSGNQVGREGWGPVGRILYRSEHEERCLSRQYVTKSIDSSGPSALLRWYPQLLCRQLLGSASGDGRK